jgi:arginase
MGKVRIIEVPCDLGAGKRGASLGIEALKLQAVQDGKQLFWQKDIKSAKNINSILHAHEPIAKTGKFVNEIASICEEATSLVEEGALLKKNILVLAGDHSTAVSTISGLVKAFPEKSLGVIWIDAHADMHSPYTSPSGNVHGMPLGAAMGRDFQRAIDDGNDGWKRMCSLSGITPAIYPESVLTIAVRDTEKPEDDFILSQGIKQISVEQFQEKGLKGVKHILDEHIAKVDMLYVTFDVDSMDPSVSKGTGTPVPNGLKQNEAEALLLYLAGNEKCKAVEMVEINPLLDNENRMAKSALTLFEKLYKTLEKRDTQSAKE